MQKAPEALCFATKKSGQLCLAPVVRGSDRCIGHGNHSSQETRRSGGRNRSNMARALNRLSPRLEELAALLQYHQQQVTSANNYGAACDRASAAVKLINAELDVYRLGLEAQKLEAHADGHSCAQCADSFADERMHGGANGKSPLPYSGN